MEQKRRAESSAGGIVKAYFDALERGDCAAVLAAMHDMGGVNRLRIYLAIGIGGVGIYGFGAEVGRG